MTDSGPQRFIDLNADCGEAATPERLAIEDAVIGFVTSVNIACGGHAGDEGSMCYAVRAAARHGVAIGAHPSFPDRVNFGRTCMDLGAAELCATIREQIAAIDAVARSEGVSIAHCKPHGALYHAASADESIARAIYRACADLDPALRLVGQAGSRAVAWWRAWGAAVSEEAFVDRVYEPDGSLRSRALQGSLIIDPDAAAEQANLIVMAESVRCRSGTVLRLVANTLCVHADTPNAAAVAGRVVGSLLAAGVTLSPLA